jgi:hypothetical protein
MTAPAIPGLVINSGAVTVVGGVSGQVPYPTAMGSQLNYLLLQNSSPYTIQVAQGLTLGQVPAFTAQVFALSGTAQPVSYTPIQGAGLIIPGLDSTLYFTWSEVEPLGAWPAAIGSSQVPFAAAVIPTLSLRNGSTTGPAVSTLGYGGMVLTSQYTSSVGMLGGPGIGYRLIIQWATDSAFTNIIARRQFIVGPGAATAPLTAPAYGGATFGTPHYGDWVRVLITAANGVALGSSSLTITAEHRGGPLSYWGPPPTAGLTPTSPTDFLGGLFSPTPLTAVAAGASLTLNSLFPFEGPAQLHNRWNASDATGGQYTTVLNAVDETGVVMQELGRWASVFDTGYGQQNLNELIVVPATQLQLILTNGTANPHSVTATLTPDYSRMSA